MIPSFEPSVQHRRGTAIFTCQTPGCEFEGIDVPYVFTINLDGSVLASCGGCRQDHTDMRIIDGPYEYSLGE